MDLKMKKNINEDFLVAIVIISSIALRKFILLSYFIQILFIGLYLKFYSKTVNKQFFFFRILYFILVVLSVLWARDISSVLRVLPSIVQIVVLSLIMCGYVNSSKRIDKIIDYFIIAGFVITINIFLFTSLSDWKNIIFYSSNEYVDISSSAGRLGPSVGLHSNGLGQILILCIMCCYYKFTKIKHKKELFLMLLLLLFLVLTKSRSSIVECIIGIFLINIFTKQKNIARLKNLIFGSIAFIIILFLLVKIPFLYNIVGYRLTGLYSIFGRVDVSDSSTLTRINFVKIGFNIFLSSPLIGVGMNNFSYIAYNKYSTWAQVYSHNNFIEILSDLGIVGFFLYYYLYFVAFKKLLETIKYYRKMNCYELSKQSSFLLVLLMVCALMNISHITYETECVQYIGMLIIVGTSVLYNDMKNRRVQLNNGG